jgi:TrmH family RNA methyltransferase
VARGGQPPERIPRAPAVGWIFGSEGGGVSPAIQARAALRVTIPVAPGTESLNVAAAAAICLHGRFSRPGAGS